MYVVVGNFSATNIINAKFSFVFRSFNLISLNEYFLNGVIKYCYYTTTYKNLAMIEFVIFVDIFYQVDTLDFDI